MATLKEKVKNLAIDSNKENKDDIEKLFSSTKTSTEFKDILIQKKYLSEEDYCFFVSKEFAIPYFDLSRLHYTQDNAGIISEDLAFRYKVFPVSKIRNIITIASAEPLDVLAIDDLRFKLSANIENVLSSASQINKALYKLYRSEKEEFLEDLEGKGDEDASVVEEKAPELGYDIVSESKKPPIVRVVDLIVSEALKKRASDIHLEPEEDRVKVRYRIDGTLYENFTLPKKNQNAISARLKIMSGLDITEFKVPQDGRFKVKMGKKEVDFRVSSLPIKHGEKFVLRALDKSNLSIGLSKLGFSERPERLFNKALQKPFGICLVTGPTGSGKSTTLYSVVNYLNTPEKNLVTIEDPVEYQIDGITQIHVNPEIGLTFANSLRAVLRQSPDVIMVGEIRDSETADIAIKASLTGEFIFSTLHTNNSVGAINRLVDMGVEPFLLASSLIVTSAQRLCRKICSHCKVKDEVEGKVLKKLGLKKGKRKFYTGKGCEFCNNTGYSGREAVLEVLLIDDTIKEMITKRASESDIIKHARENLEFKNLREDALEKAFRGVTSIGEVLRVT